MQSASHRESVAASANGYLMFFVGLGLVLVGAAAIVQSAGQAMGLFASGVLALVAAVLVFLGLYMLQPNEAGILTLFGSYTGTDRNAGLRWANPLKAKRKLSLRARNLNVAALKVNDKRGNPIEIGAVVVWRVRDSAQAVFDVDNYELFVSLQAEAAVRHLASLYAYDDGDDLRAGETTLRAGQDEVAAALQKELGARFAPAGVEVLDAKLTHLAYAPEIAQVMLRRQQAEAVISARQKIVLGAVSMVESALQGLSERRIVELDDERKAAMVSNLLVVLCSDRETQPVVNTGTLYN
jgi:regulator of protease activity HflC (stomatin/prohibitin superfamily)